jgi:ribosomal protein S19
MARKIKKTKEQKKHILIALEDTKSSKFYIQTLLKDKSIVPHIVFAKLILY